MRVLITGAAGFIGNNLSLRLLERGDEVIGVDALDTYYDVTLKEARLERTLAYDGFTDVRARIEDREAMAETFKKYQPQRVINLAAQAGVRYSIENPAAYVTATWLASATSWKVVGTMAWTTWCMPRPVRYMAPIPICRSRCIKTSTTRSACMQQAKRPMS